MNRPLEFLVLPGDGIGPEITRATLTVLDAVQNHFALDWRITSMDIGLTTLKTRGTTLPPEVLDTARRMDGVMLGPISHFDYPARDQGGINASAEFRTKLDLYANIRPSRSRPTLPSARAGMDLIIVRENTEGFYADRNMVAGSGEMMPTEDMALAIRKITAHACERIARTAFELATTRRSKVTAVHKANVLRLSDGLFLREVRKVAQDYPTVDWEDMIVDAAAARLIRDPERFDIIVTTNMFGDILSDEAGELSGSLGLAGSLNAGDDFAVAQAQHGSAPDIQGQDSANPTALILSAAMLLEWLGRRHENPELSRAASAIERTIDRALADPALRTADLGGSMGTQRFAAAVAAMIDTDG